MIRALWVSAILMFAGTAASANDVLIECSRDLRAGDGPLIVYKLEKDSENSLSLVMETSQYSYVTRKVEKTVVTKGRKLRCDFSRMDDDILFQCSVDHLALDGPKVTFKLEKYDNKGKFALIRESLQYSMTSSEKFTSKETLSKSLVCKPYYGT